MDLQWFRDLEALKISGHFSLAAHRLNISQPALSRRIKSLEDWAGFALVDRSSRPASLTLAGEQILEVALSSIQRLEDECAALRQTDKLDQNFAVRFAAQHSIAWRFFPSWLQDFETQFGPIVSRVRADDLPDCISSFLNGEVDFLIAYNDPLVDYGTPPQQFEKLHIGKDCLIPACKPDPTGRPLFALDAQPENILPYVGFSGSSSLGKLFARTMRLRPGTARLKLVYENSLVGALRVRAWNGTGISWLPESLIAQDIENGLLCRAGDHHWDIDLDINLFRLHAKPAPQLQLIWQHLTMEQTASIRSAHPQPDITTSE